MTGKPASIAARTAARLFLGAQGLLDDPNRRANRATTLAIIRRLGFVQIDSINVVTQAQHLTLHARHFGYRREHLRRLLEDDRALFEHWTHDASVIPVEHYGQWKPRFVRDERRIADNAWWRGRMGEPGHGTVEGVLERVRTEGPVRSADFEHDEGSAGWWAWKPQKAALEYLWRSGKLAVARRERSQKVYDLSERVLPEHHAPQAPGDDEHAAWACETAAERLVVFTARELAAFWASIDLAAARRWCAAALAEGRVEPVEVRSADGSEPQAAFALAGWRERVLPEAPPIVRLLCPFDPVLRDRARALRRFGFDYRFEAFVPAPRRQYGYYVMPALEGERLVARLDPKLHRERGELEIKGVWWEPGVKVTRARKAALEEAVGRLGDFVGATTITWPR